MPTAIANKLPGIAGSLLNVIPFPNRFNWLGKIGLGRRNPIIDASKLSIAEDARVMETIQRLAQHTHMMAEAGSWDELHDLIHSFDASCAFYGGRRLASVAIEGALHPIYPPVQNHISAERIAMFEEALLDRPEDKVLAAITAAAHLSQANATEGQARGKKHDHGVLSTYYHHIEKATDILADFDPIALRSPMIGRLKHRVAVHHDYAPTDIEGAFDNCMFLDATDWGAMGQQARALSRTGSRAGDHIEVAARQTMAKTQNTAGAAAYAAFYLGLLEQDTIVWQDFDCALFEQGLEDMVNFGGNDQLQINFIAAELMKCKIDGLRAVALRFIRKHLRAVVIGCWNLSASQRQKMLAYAWAEDLQEAQKVDVDPQGVAIDGVTVAA